MRNRIDVTVPMSVELDEQVKGQLEYGDSRAEWIREACRRRLEAEGVNPDAIPGESDDRESVAD